MSEGFFPDFVKKKKNLIVLQMKCLKLNYFNNKKMLKITAQLLVSDRNQ